MGRRRQHSGGLALASDRIPGLNHNNIDSGLVTFHASLPGLSQLSKAMLLQQTEKTQAEIQSGHAALPFNKARGRRMADERTRELHVTYRKQKPFSPA